MMTNRKPGRGLGRGLSSLLSDTDLSATVKSDVEPAKSQNTLPIEFLYPNKNQPRKNFDQDELEGLAQSIGEKGVIQPILVRKIDESHYQIIAGERRWRAATMAKLHKVPVVIRELDEDEEAQIALIENVQRSDLTPTEEARGYEQLMAQKGLTQENLSKIIGKPRSHIANMVRILNLPESVRDMLDRREISFGHAKLLVNSEDAEQLARLVVKNNMSVRELEKLVSNSEQLQKGKAARPQALRKDADTVLLEKNLKSNLGMAVKINHKESGGGSLSIDYKDLDQLDRLCQILSQ